MWDGRKNSEGSGCAPSTAAQTHRECIESHEWLIVCKIFQFIEFVSKKWSNTPDMAIYQPDDHEWDTLEGPLRENGDQNWDATLVILGQWSRKLLVVNLLTLQDQEEILVLWSGKAITEGTHQCVWEKRTKRLRRSHWYGFRGCKMIQISPGRTVRTDVFVVRLLKLPENTLPERFITFNEVHMCGQSVR